MAAPGRVLTLDLGNTSLKGCLWECGRPVFGFRLPHGAAPDASLAAALAGVQLVLGVAARGLAPQHPFPFLGRGVWVGRELEPPGRPAYDRPEDLGFDRRLACFPVWRGGGGLVLDAGTCLTATGAAPDGTLYGLAILPGREALRRALAAAAPALAPDLGAGAPVPAGAPPRGTAGNLALGLAAAWRGAVEALLAEARNRLFAPGRVPARIYLTGTDAAALAAELSEGEHRPGLVHEGLFLLAAEAGLCTAGGEA